MVGSGGVLKSCDPTGCKFVGCCLLCETPSLRVDLERLANSVRGCVLLIRRDVRREYSTTINIFRRVVNMLDANRCLTGCADVEHAEQYVDRIFARTNASERWQQEQAPSDSDFNPIKSCFASPVYASWRAIRQHRSSTGDNTAI